MWVDGVGYVPYKTTGGPGGECGPNGTPAPDGSGTEDEGEDEGEEEDESDDSGSGDGSEEGERESSYTALQLQRADEAATASSRCWVRAAPRLEMGPGGWRLACWGAWALMLVGVVAAVLVQS
jgi:hypothetical protein